MADATADVLTANPTLTGLDEQMRVSGLLKQKNSGSSVDSRLGSMAVDPNGKLVQGSGDQSDAISGLNREQRRQTQAELPQTPSAATAGSQKASFSDIGGAYRQQIAQARNLAGSMKGQVANMAAQAVSRITSQLLKASWENLIDSFGATLIYINLHVFCRFVFGEKFFCKLGREWLPSMANGGVGSTDILKTPSLTPDMPTPATSGGMGGTILGLPMAGFGLLETAVLAGLDILLFVMIIVSLTPIIILVFAISNPTETFSFIASIIGLVVSSPAGPAN